MADEAQLTISLSIRKDNLVYTASDSFRADVSGAKGPTPGAVTVSVSGTDIDFSQLTTPGLCKIKNLDSDNWVEWGPYDPDTDVFYPVGELLPGEVYPLRLSRHLNQESTGTGTLPGYNSRIRFRANVAACVVQIEAFET